MTALAAENSKAEADAIAYELKAMMNALGGVDIDKALKRKNLSRRKKVIWWSYNRVYSIIFYMNSGPITNDIYYFIENAYTLLL